MTSYVEHANISVVDMVHTTQFLLAAIPSWEVRGGGEYQNIDGETVEWNHIGDDRSYIALNSLGEGTQGEWTDRFTGVKHIGIAVLSVDNLIARLSQAGFELDHWGAEHPHRKNVYYVDKHNVQFEFIEYYSDKAEERNDYHQ
ncbi:VOC family protein [Vibrio sp. LaRot3]|uniref:VOC family protein n=1 Tax=Vibrio sp. LaRot3 TaxID=2998829 RepID=UPI0022CDCA76|nr:VOC family protein [Vibrio sp. LaRot3]MDA0147449.1 VOC family protein [Vibrio sp. LaRot3]